MIVNTLKLNAGAALIRNSFTDALCSTCCVVPNYWIIEGVIIPDTSNFTSGLFPVGGEHYEIKELLTTPDDYLVYSITKFVYDDKKTGDKKTIIWMREDFRKLFGGSGRYDANGSYIVYQKQPPEFVTRHLDGYVDVEFRRFTVKWQIEYRFTFPRDTTVRFKEQTNVIDLRESQLDTKIEVWGGISDQDQGVYVSVPMDVKLRDDGTWETTSYDYWRSAMQQEGPEESWVEVIWRAKVLEVTKATVIKSIYGG